MTLLLVLALVAAIAGAASAVALLRRERAEARALAAEREEEVAVLTARTVADEGRMATLVRALDAIPQGVVLGDHHGVVVYANDGAVEYLAARHGEALVGAAIRDLLVAAAEGRSEVRTVDLFGPPPRVVELEGTALGDGGVVVVEDVTERRRLDAVRRDFVANISHELRTPVGAISLLAETLLDEDDPELVARLAQRVVDESFRVTRTIDDLLQLSEIEVGSRAEVCSLSVADVVHEAVDRIRPAAELAGIGLDVGEAPDGLSIRGDRRQLASAVFNLLDNAVKYSEPGSQVVVRVRLSNGNAEVSVSDHGLGIPSRDLERIFERFYRVDRARSRDTGGTGLGLAIVRHVVQNHGGDVAVRSREGEGSTFTLILPAGAGAANLTPEGSRP